MALEVNDQNTSALASADGDEAGVHLSLTGRMVYPQDDRVLQFLREGWFEYRQLAMMSRLVRPGDCFVDVGAHCGLFSRIAERRLAGKGTIVTVEPNPHLHPFIRRNVAIQQAVTVEPITRFSVNLVGAAISNGTGEAVLHTGESGWTAYSTLQPKGSERFGTAIRVATRPLESLIAEPSEGAQVIVKLDTEGLEFDILQHALPFLGGRGDLHLLVEIDENNQALSNHTSGELISLIKDAGYQLADFDAGTGLLVPFQAEEALWGANLMATKDLQLLNARLSSVDVEVALETEDFLQRGAAAERIYRRSEGLERMLRASRQSCDALAAIEAILQGRQSEDVEAVQHLGADIDPSDEQTVRAAIARMDDGSARLAGSARGIVEQLASARADRDRLNETLVHLTRRLKDQRKTIAKERAVISGREPEPFEGAGEDGQSWDLSKVMAAADSTADEIGKLIGAARYLSERLQGKRSEIAETLGKDVAQGNGEKAPRVTLDIARATPVKVGKSASTSGLPSEYDRRIEAYERLRAEAAEAESALQRARRALAELIAKSSLARAKGEKTADEDLLSLQQHIKENLTSAAWHLATGQRQLTMAVPDMRLLQDRDASDSELARLRAANRDLSAEIHRIGILLGTARKSRWLSLGKRVGADVSQQIDRIVSLIAEIERCSPRADNEARS